MSVRVLGGRRIARQYADNATAGLRAALAQIRYTDQLALTFAWWYFRTATPGGSRNFAVCSGAPGNGWDVTLLNTNVIRYADAFTTTSKRVNSTSTPALNAWTHCVVRDSDLTNVTAAGTVDFVINGVPEAGTLVSNGSGSHSTGTAKNFSLGGQASAPGGLYLPAIWERRLGDSEVGDLYAGADPRDFAARLIGFWPWDGRDGNNCERDLSGFGLPLFSFNTGLPSYMSATSRLFRARPRSRTRFVSTGAGITATSTQTLPISGSATATVGVSASSSAALPISGSAAAAVDVTASSSAPLPISGSSTATVGVAATSVQALPIAGASTAVVAVTATSVQPLPLGGSATAGSGTLADSNRPLPLSGSSSATVAVQATSVLVVPIAGAAGMTVSIQATSARPLPIAGASSLVVAIAASSICQMPFSGFANLIIGIVLDDPALAYDGLVLVAPALDGRAFADPALDGRVYSTPS